LIEENIVHRDEAELVDLARRGDKNAFAELLRAHQDFAYNLALRSLGDPHEAEDLTQEAFVRAWQALPRFRGDARFRTWLYRIVANLCYNRLPHLRRELSALGDSAMDGAAIHGADTGSGDPGEGAIANLPAGSSGDPLSRLEAQERRAFLHRQIEALPEGYRLLVTLRYQQELSYAEIAEVVDLPLGTVKTGLFRARQRLRQALQEYEQEPVWTS